MLVSIPSCPVRNRIFCRPFDKGIWNWTRHLSSIAFVSSSHNIRWLLYHQQQQQQHQHQHQHQHQQQQQQQQQQQPQPQPQQQQQQEEGRALGASSVLSKMQS